MTKNINAEIETLTAKEKVLAEAKRALKEAQAIKEWEAKTKARNPQYVVGSRRKATEADAETLTHVHGQVCSITCASCGCNRVVNVQDAFQARYCTACKKEANKASGKAKRADKRLAGRSVEDLQKEIEEAQAALAAITGSVQVG